ncbi:MAG: alanine--tRNA ligase, partial [Candidatus Nanoarchaeia archaeon]|nr:alanine--tRNA ligase [Candidatus Nanoarchaeia archaeon]
NDYYATSYLKNEGFSRHKCEKCKLNFWSSKPSKVCGDPSCSGGFRFLEDNPVKKKMDYLTVWKEFSSMFKKFGYSPIKRYPTVSRWNPTMDYTIASIAAFQPYVVSGEVKPPANPLVIPQFCLRFTDIDNVGITGSHMTGFVMIGQHAFVPPKEWDQELYFSHIHTWLKKGLGLPNEEITFHEDTWAGGGNFGPCMEFFSRGVEIGNQVYMLYEKTTSGKKELPIKVLDMGMGQERNAWFSQGSNTIYEAVFPTVCKNLLKSTGLKTDAELIRKYVPHAGLLNIDEIKNSEKTWKEVAKKVGTDTKNLKETILPSAALYSIAEHTRALLIALNDGALPSNTGGGYNLRVLFRRAMSFISKYGWKIDLPTVCKWHAEYLKPQFPELLNNLDNVTKILEVEKSKYENTVQKSRSVVQNMIKKGIKEEDLITVYDSQGISPELIANEAKKLGKTIEVPDNFYVKVAERHEQKEQEAQTKKQLDLDLKNIPDTEILYFSNYKADKFDGKVLKIIDNKYVITDKTVFYPTSGGQMHDIGTLGDSKVVDVFKQGAIVIHVLGEKPKFKINDKVHGEIDLARRIQLAQHHTGTHILNAAVKRLLGDHIYQAGAKKTPEKAHLDVTHYESISDEDLRKIENEANKLINENLPVNSKMVPRDEAEKKYGTVIYQGGAVPGKVLRIIEVPEVDVEACGGTHLKSTGEIGKIHILKSSKIQDGIVRIEFVAGAAAIKEVDKDKDLLEETAKILGVDKKEVPARAEELFTKWKKAKKASKKGEKLGPEFKLTIKETENLPDKELLHKTAQIFSTQPEYVPKTAKRFLDELKSFTK